MVGSAPPPLYFEQSTPAGIDVRYYPQNKDAGIKRHYEIRKAPPGPGQTSTNFLGEHDWQEVPSVTTILEDFKDSGGLVWHAFRVGIQGTINTYKKHRGEDGYLRMGSGDWKAMEAYLKASKQTPSDVKSSAGDRGTEVHTAMELWANFQVSPDPEMYGEEERGYVKGLRMFLEALAPAEPEVVVSERMVGSLEHGFAGRYDLEIRTHKAVQLAKRWTPKRGPQFEMLQPGLHLVDLKTSAQVYKESHFPQLEGYEIARLECGYEPTDGRYVLHVHPGDPEHDKQPDEPYYEFAKSTARPQTFLAVLEAYKELGAL